MSNEVIAHLNIGGLIVKLPAYKAGLARHETGHQALNEIKEYEK